MRHKGIPADLDKVKPIQAVKVTYNNLPKLIKRMRVSRGLCQSELAKHFGISLTAISLWETDRNRPPTNTLLDLVDYLGYDLIIVPKKGPKNEQTNN
jgi:DNA-binding transcriptional regulator YiaG